MSQIPKHLLQMDSVNYQLYPNHLQIDFYSQGNILYLNRRINELICQTYGTGVITIPEGDIVRIMNRVYTERVQNIVQMNTRVIMYIMSDINEHHIDTKKYLNYTENYVAGQKLIDMSSGKGMDLKIIKNFDKFNRSKLNFYFTN